MHTDSLTVICCWSICHVFVWDRNGHRDSGRILTCVEFLRYVFDLAGQHGPAVLACGLTDLDSLLLCQHSLKSSTLAGGEVHSSSECNHKRRCLDMQDCRNWPHQTQSLIITRITVWYVCGLSCFQRITDWTRSFTQALKKEK